MLDKDLYYSCGYFPRYGMTLEDAQREKSFHIAKKLLLEPGMNVVDIGSGWGSLDFFLASNFNVNVTGLNICEKQLEYSTKKAKELNIPNVKFLDKDYRSHNKKYDAVVSVGMLEHVGKACYTDYFKSVDKMLSEDGVALIHFIGVNSPVGGHNPWMDKNIFPGGYIPSLNEVIEPIEKTGLYITDIETWMGTHYASTLRFWVMNLENNRNKIIEKFGIEEYRKWRFYLLASETGFKYGDLVVYQIQLGRQSSRIPLSRDYMYR
jgi:cyclopropane-fatty-acyl-phospholipid synthase